MTPLSGLAPLPPLAAADPALAAPVRPPVPALEVGVFPESVDAAASTGFEPASFPCWPESERSESEQPAAETMNARTKALRDMAEYGCCRG
jgi:hypothetical protein